AVADYVGKLPAANGKVAVAGFCWGGEQAFRFATKRPSLSAAFVFYGLGPDSPEAIAAIKAPVYGFYAGNDARIGATIPKTQELMKAAGKTYEVVTYDGAGHGFMRAGEAPDATPANKKARDQGFTRLVTLIKEMKSPPAATNATRNKTVATKKSAAPAIQCHDSSVQMAGSM